MSYIHFAYINFKYMQMGQGNLKDDVMFVGSLTLMSECVEKLLKQLIFERTKKLPDNIHQHRTLLTTLIDKAGLTELKKYKSLCLELTNIFYTRRYPNSAYYLLSREEYQDVYDEGYNMIKDLIYLIEDKGDFTEEFPQEANNTSQKNRTSRMSLDNKR